MSTGPIKNWLKALPISSKFSIIIGSIVVVLVCIVMTFWFVMNTMSSIRGYVNGEGLWSKGQKEASYSLSRYAVTFDAAHYNDFKRFLRVPLGDKQARIELDKPNPDYAIVREGFLDGDNHPDDIDGMIFLYRNFKHVSYLSRAIEIWKKGDEKIEELVAVAEEMHAIIEAAGTPRTLQERLILEKRLEPILKRNERVDRELTVLENQFSNVLGEGSRAIGSALLLLVSFMSFALGALVLFIARSIGQMVSQVDKSKSELVAFASHQLRTPLTVIRWAAEEMLMHKQRSFTQEERSSLQTILNSTIEMGALIGTVLDLSRVDLGELRVTLVDLDLVKTAKDALTEIVPIANKKHISITERYGAHSIPFKGDRELLRIIFQNLLTNAVKYSPHGATVVVSVERKGGDVIISVEDNGYGIPKDDQVKIFSKLFRASNAPHAHAEGSGLGLYILYSIIQKTGGDITFTSHEGKGTAFQVVYPDRGMSSSGWI
jgi:signal transduction histidine kinase